MHLTTATKEDYEKRAIKKPSIPQAQKQKQKKKRTDTV
jgi:hypothetical protein